MVTHPLWNEDYWLLVLQLYLKQPVGVKPMYSRKVVDLSLELHLPPRVIHQQMEEIDRRDRFVLQLIWDTYAADARRLGRDVAKLRRMKGFGKADSFYDGVTVRSTFERDFLPLEEDGLLKPVMLVLILDLYFRLTPATMEERTPEVADLARLMRLQPRKVVEVLEAFQQCDPYLMRSGTLASPLLRACGEVWNRYANGPQEDLSAHAEELRAYFE